MNRTEQNIFIYILQCIENTTGGLPEEPCGSSMLAAPKTTISKKTINAKYKRKIDRQDKKWEERNGERMQHKSPEAGSTDAVLRAARYVAAAA